MLDFTGQRAIKIFIPADTAEIIRNDDGLSISNAKRELIEKEANRFKEIFDFSIIPNKHIVYVNDGNQFRSKKDIYNEITKILNQN